jgi:serine/threonine-protein kinase SRPK3
MTYYNKYIKTKNKYTLLKESINMSQGSALAYYEDRKISSHKKNKYSLQHRINKSIKAQYGINLKGGAASTTLSATVSALYEVGMYCRINLGDILTNTFSTPNRRYKVLHNLGQGSFSQVWLVKDLEDGELYAIKVSKSDNDYRGAAIKEIEICELIKQIDPSDMGYKHVLNMIDHFDHTNPTYPSQSHICIVYELAICNLYDGYSQGLFDEFYNTNNILRSDIFKTITKQILLGTKYLNEICFIIHCDLKPENILLGLSTSMYEDVKAMIDYILIEYDGDYAEMSIRINDGLIRLYTQFIEHASSNVSEITIKISDFGLSHIEGKLYTSYVQSRMYRAPELLLHLNYRFITIKIDIWSIGCILFEILIRGPLFFRYGSPFEIIEDIIFYLAIDDFDTMINSLSIKRFLDQTKLKEIRKEIYPSPLKRDILTRLLGRQLNLEDASRINRFLLYILNIDPNSRPLASDILEIIEEGDI